MTTSIIFLVIGSLLFFATILVLILWDTSLENEGKTATVFILMFLSLIFCMAARDLRPFNSKNYYVSKTVITKTVNGKEVKRDTLMRFELKNK